MISAEKIVGVALLTVLFVGAGLFTTAGQAQSVKIVGMGASNCAQFLQDIETNPRAERDYFAWAQGYMSGLLIRAPTGKDEDLDLTPSAFPLSRQAAFLRTFCTTARDADFSDAVNMLYRTLRAPPG